MALRKAEMEAAKVFFFPFPFPFCSSLAASFGYKLLKDLMMKYINYLYSTVSSYYLLLWIVLPRDNITFQT